MSQTNPLISSTSRQPPRHWKWIVIAGVAIALVALICLGLAIIGSLNFFQRSQREAEAALDVVRVFMKAGAQNEPVAGFSLFDQTAPDQTVTQERVAQLFTERRDVFQGYTDVQQEGFSIYHGTNGTMASVQGKITYPDKPAKGFAAQLLQTNGVWRLTSIQFADSLGN